MPTDDAARGHSAPGGTTLDDLVDDAVTLHRRARAMSYVVDCRVAHGDGDGCLARTARTQLRRLTEQHAVAVERAVIAARAHLDRMPTAQETP